ncbi:hypothetical protein SDC9_130527 [bioreactor metagenome]|uniref:Uncharacterized protein n=1 Tax=bioreactor metagenome TaxID=1076179 RepID=A0A645D2Y0_9ZZZZ
MHDTRQIGELEPFLQDEASRKIQRSCAHHGHVVDRAMHRQAADVAAGEEQGRHDMGVGGHDQTAFAGVRQQGTIVALGEVFVAEMPGEQLLNQLRHCPAARAVGHIDLAVFDVEGSDVVFTDFSHGNESDDLERIRSVEAQPSGIGPQASKRCQATSL